MVELVKNSYDADSSFCNVVVDSDCENSSKNTFYPDACGKIMIEDDGVGMDLETIRRGWLTISNSLKREMKQKGETTDKGRTPLGDKGLGRLAVQRLGDNLEIFTYPKDGSKGFHVGFSWKDFEDEKVLTKVRVNIEELPYEDRYGTKIVISDLRSKETWKGNSVELLRKKLSALISPYQEVRDFQVVATVDGKSLELTEIAEKIRDTSFIRYRIVFDKKKGLRVFGRFRLGYFKPFQNELKQKLFYEYVERDNGNEFFRRLSEKNESKTYNVKFSDSKKWFIETEYCRSWDDLDGLDYVDGSPAYPGPFSGEVDYFLLDEGIDEQDIFNKKREYSNFIKQLSGIRVYRDGFGIRVDEDWLGLSKQQTSGKSWYGLRPKNTLGFIAISAKDNALLEETTNREGFTESAYYNNFYEILQIFVRTTSSLQEFVRREMNDFLRDKKGEDISEETKIQMEEIIRKVKTGGHNANESKKTVHNIRENVENSRQTIRHTKKRIEDSFKDEPNKIKEAIMPFEEIDVKLQESMDSLSQVEDTLKALSKQSEESDVLLLEVEHIKEQLNIAYETMSLGLTVEGLSHEMENIVERLSDKTHQISKHLEKIELNDSKTLTYIEIVKNTLSSLKKQLSHISPSLRYVREKRQLVDLNIFWDEELNYYQNRLERRDIDINVINSNNNSFIIRINRGKLFQIIDNILLNAEYWIGESIRRNMIENGIITIELEPPLMRIWDNGMGIDQSVNTSLFEPFITCKGKGKGRGLGLFIVRQFLDSEGCTIRLLSDTNKFGRRYKFEIDWEGALSEN